VFGRLAAVSDDSFAGVQAELPRNMKKADGVPTRMSCVIKLAKSQAMNASIYCDQAEILLATSLRIAKCQPDQK
jgi:hypothetical protein